MVDPFGVAGVALGGVPFVKPLLTTIYNAASVIKLHKNFGVDFAQVNNILSLQVIRLDRLRGVNTATLGNDESSVVLACLADIKEKYSSCAELVSKYQHNVIGRTTRPSIQWGAVDRKWVLQKIQEVGAGIDAMQSFFKLVVITAPAAAAGSTLDLDESLEHIYRRCRRLAMNRSSKK